MRLLTATHNHNVDFLNKSWQTKTTTTRMGLLTEISRPPHSLCRSKSLLDLKWTSEAC